MTLRDTAQDLELLQAYGDMPDTPGDHPKRRRRRKRRPQHGPRFWRCETCERVSVDKLSLCDPVPCP